MAAAAFIGVAHGEWAVLGVLVVWAALFVWLSGVGGFVVGFALAALSDLFDPHPDDEGPPGR